MLRIHSPLPEETELLIERTIGCLIAVHRDLGPGLTEDTYERAICLELSANGIPFERQKRFDVSYRGEFLCHYYADIIVGGALVLELKSVEAFAPIHHAQIITYMRLAKLRAGLLVNFNVAVLKDGIKRKVL